MYLLRNSERSKSRLQADPTRTTLLRKRFMADVVKGFAQLQRDLTQLIVEEDAFGLKRRSHNPAVVIHERYVALTSRQQMEEFRKWLKERVDAQVLRNVDTGAKNWLEQYIQEAYEKGTGRALDDYLRKHQEYYGTKQGAYYQGTKDEFLRSSFRRPASIERVQLLASRAYTDLKGVTEAMSTQMNRIMTDSIIQGKSPRETARQLNKAVEGIGKNRARMIARTETIRAHADGQLDALKNLGVTEVGVMVEWSTAGDNLVCQLCADMNGAVIKIKDATSMIPRHPNCRCAWLPANIGEDTSGQKRGKDAEKAIEASIKSEIPKKYADTRTAAEQRILSKWKGADKEKLGRPLKSPLYDKAKPEPKPKPKLPGTPKVPKVPKAKVAPPSAMAAPTAEETMAQFQALSLEEKLKHPMLDDLRKKYLEESAATELRMKELTSKWVDYQTAINYETNRFIELTEKIDAAGALPRAEYAAEVAKLKEQRKIISDRVALIRNEMDRIKLQRDSLQMTQQNVMERTLGLPMQERCQIKGATPDLIVDYYDHDKNVWRKTLDVPERSKDFEASDRFLSSLMSNRNGVQEVKYTSHILDEGERAFCKPSDTFKAVSQQGIYVTAKESQGVITHEIGHELEARVKDGHKLAKEFRDLRVTRAGTADVKLAEQFPGYNYRADEIGNKDEFDKALSESSAYYVGKSYGQHELTEVVSMGVQALVESPLKLAEKDPEYFNFIIGYLRGVL